MSIKEMLTWGIHIPEPLRKPPNFRPQAWLTAGTKSSADKPWKGSSWRWLGRRQELGNLPKDDLMASWWYQKFGDTPPGISKKEVKLINGDIYLTSTGNVFPDLNWTPSTCTTTCKIRKNTWCAWEKFQVSFYLLSYPVLHEFKKHNSIAYKYQ